MPLHPAIAAVTAKIEARSRDLRAAYDRFAMADMPRVKARNCLSCSNLAHVAAAMPEPDKTALAGDRAVNLGIVTSYNDMLSAHAPFAEYPALIRDFAAEKGATVQVAGGVPAMCDGVTQGQLGMELSLLSRDTIALSTAVALSHAAFDGVICLGTCDKIGPGLLIGALQFPHLPVIFSPAGPMPSGISNAEKARIRQLHAEGKVDEAALLDSEMRAYHARGTCTFYGTANSNQVLIEVMGLHMPGTAFAPPDSALRAALLRSATLRLAELAENGDSSARIGRIVSAKSIVNAIVALLATGGSTNHTIHWIAVARAAGLIVTWDDFDALSKIVPLLARIYPNGSADINAFERAGGIGFMIRELLDAGLLHEDVETIAGPGLRRYAQSAVLCDDALSNISPPAVSGDASVLRPANDPFERESGLRILSGNLGRAVIKTSAVKPENRVVTAPARIFASQESFIKTFKAGEISADCVVVLRFQGPRANGMPELHKLIPALSSLIDRGLRVALVTDGRLSGASGKVAAALHVTPEAASGGPLARLRDGDVITVDGVAGVLSANIPDEVLVSRDAEAAPDPSPHIGRGLFSPLRQWLGPADEGASFVGGLV